MPGLDGDSTPSESLLANGTVLCSRCGTPNAQGQPTCMACGLVLLPANPQAAPAQAPPAPQPAPNFGKQTMLGGMGGLAPTGGQGRPTGALAQTMLGGVAAQQGGFTPPVGPAAPAPQPAAQPVAPANPPAPSAAFKGTMLGGIAPAFPAQSPQSEAANPPAPGAAFKGTMLGMAPPAPAPAASPAEQNPAPFKGTMLGMAPPAGMQPAMAAPAMQPPIASPPEPAAMPPIGPPLAGPAPGVLPADKRTVLGVAVPGIAPLNPGVAKPAAQPEYTPQPAYTPPAVARYPATSPIQPELSQQELALAGKRPGRHISPLMLVLILGISALVSIGGVVVFLLLRGSPSLRAAVTVDAAGNEQLELVCDACAEASSVALDGRTATFRGHRTTVALAHPLKIGDNVLAVALSTPGSHHPENITLNVPVQFRVRGDLAGLAESPPKLRVRIDAVAGTRVVVDNKPLALDARGSATYDTDISSKLMGSVPSTEQLEQKVPYTITPPVGAARSDVVAFQLPIVPLMVDSPGDGVVIETANFMLTGRTQKGATVTVAGRAIPIDDQGRFEQLMSVSAVGETTIDVRASVADRAPRLAPIHVKRVAHLADEADAYRAQAETSYAAVASDIDAKKGARVAFVGTATDVRVDNHVTLLLLDVHEGCPAAPCLARVLYGAKTEVTNGDTVSAFGKVVGAVDGPRTGSKIPNVIAEFVLRGRK